LDSKQSPAAWNQGLGNLVEGRVVLGGKQDLQRKQKEKEHQLVENKERGQIKPLGRGPGKGAKAGNIRKEKPKGPFLRNKKKIQAKNHEEGVSFKCS